MNRMWSYCSNLSFDHSHAYYLRQESRCKILIRRVGDNGRLNYAVRLEALARL
jgi:hypothetical protein